MNEKELKNATGIFKALADPNRLRIFAELMAGDTRARIQIRALCGPEGNE